MIWQFWDSLVRYFVECCSVLICLIVFLWLDWNLRFWWEDQRQSSSHYIISSVYMLLRWLTTDDANLGHLAEVLLGIFLYYFYCPHSNPLFCALFCKNKSLSILHIQGLGNSAPSTGRVNICKWFGILLCRRLVSCPIYLSIWSSVYIMWTHGH